MGSDGSDGRLEVRDRTMDETPSNPAGTQFSRGINDVAGTNIRGAHPENKDPGQG
jgi:hypothetical protein